jgi:hypothetical protein
MHEAPIIQLKIDQADLVHLRDGATSGNDWLFALAYDWLEEAGMLSTLWDVLLDMSPRHRLAAGALIARAANRENAAEGWLTGSDPALRIAGARLLARKPDVTPEQLQSLAQDDNGAVRAALFAELTEQENLLELDRLGQVSLMRTPVRWTCDQCAAVTGWDEGACPRCQAGRPRMADS